VRGRGDAGGVVKREERPGDRRREFQHLAERRTPVAIVRPDPTCWRVAPSDIDQRALLEGDPTERYPLDVVGSAGVIPRYPIYARPATRTVLRARRPRLNVLRSALRSVWALVLRVFPTPSDRACALLLVVVTAWLICMVLPQLQRLIVNGGPTP
jgi:hypothetical protein